MCQALIFEFSGMPRALNSPPRVPSLFGEWTCSHVPEKALINHRNMVNYNKTFWETRKHVGIPWLKQSIICRNVEYLSALVTLAPRHQSAQTSRLLFRSACTSACTSTATRLTGRPEPRHQSQGCGKYGLVPPNTHKGRGPGEEDKQPETGPRPQS